MIVVNTCAFIDGAKQESIDTILEMAQTKNDGRPAPADRHRVPRRALPRRAAGRRSPRSMPCSAPARCPTSSRRSRAARPARGRRAPAPVHAVHARRPTGTSTPSALKGIAARHRDAGGDARPADLHLRRVDTPRVLTTPRHYAYVKVAEGCDYNCASASSRRCAASTAAAPHDDIVREARQLAARGVKELILISQDTTFYGIDRQERGALARLLRRAVGASTASSGSGCSTSTRPRSPTTCSTRWRESPKVCALHRPAAAARAESDAEAHAAAGQPAPPTSGCSTASASACRASRCARRSSSASRARPTTSSTTSARSCERVEFDHVGRLHLLARGGHGGLRPGRRRAARP